MQKQWVRLLRVSLKGFIASQNDKSTLENLLEPGWQHTAESLPDTKKIVSTFSFTGLIPNVVEYLIKIFILYVNMYIFCIGIVY